MKNEMMTMYLRGMYVYDCVGNTVHDRLAPNTLQYTRLDEMPDSISYFGSSGAIDAPPT